MIIDVPMYCTMSETVNRVGPSLGRSSGLVPCHLSSKPISQPISGSGHGRTALLPSLRNRACLLAEDGTIGPDPDGSDPDRDIGPWVPTGPPSTSLPVPDPDRDRGREGPIGIGRDEGPSDRRYQAPKKGSTIRRDAARDPQGAPTGRAIGSQTRVAKLRLGSTTAVLVELCIKRRCPYRH